MVNYVFKVESSEESIGWIQTKPTEALSLLHTDGKKRPARASPNNGEMNSPGWWFPSAIRLPCHLNDRRIIGGRRWRGYNKRESCMYRCETSRPCKRRKTGCPSSQIQSLNLTFTGGFAAGMARCVGFTDSHDSGDLFHGEGIFKSKQTPLWSKTLLQ